jgi:hypothetical protein
VLTVFIKEVLNIYVVKSSLINFCMHSFFQRMKEWNQHENWSIRSLIYDLFLKGSDNSTICWPYLRKHQNCLRWWKFFTCILNIFFHLSQLKNFQAGKCESHQLSLPFWLTVCLNTVGLKSKVDLNVSVDCWDYTG